MLVYAPGWTLAANFEVNHPPQSWLFRSQNNGNCKFTNSPLKTVISDPKFQAKMAFFRRKFCYAVFDSREQQAIPPD